MSKDRDSDKASFFTETKYYLAGLATVLLTGAVLFIVIPNQMIVHDEGQYAEGAARILRGELPHRDFHEMYTGLLSFAHAGVFQVLGEKLVHLRYFMILLALPACWAAFDIGVRLTGRLVFSSILGFAAIYLSIGVIHAPMANCYLALLAIFCLWTLLRANSSGRFLWFLILGIVLGLALCVKITGIYLVAAVGLAVASSVATSNGQVEIFSANRIWQFILFSLAAIAPIVLLRNNLTVDSIAFFAAPIWVSSFAIFLLKVEVNWEVLKRYTWVGIGLLGSSSIFLSPWWIQGAIPELAFGVFELPKLRLTSFTASFPAPPLIGSAGFYLMTFPLACFLPAGNLQWQRYLQLFAVIGVAISLLVGLIDDQLTNLLTIQAQIALNGWRWLPLGISICSTYYIYRNKSRDSLECRQLFFATSLSAFFNLHQFPYAIPFYQFFCLPLIILSLVVMVTHKGGTNRNSTVLPTCAIVALICFCMFRFGIDGVWGQYMPSVKSRRVSISGINTTPEIAGDYMRIRKLANDVLSESQTILAGPDCPEVYFFTGRKNPTPYMYDIFVTDNFYEEKLFQLSESDEIGMVIFNMAPEFSDRWRVELFNRMREEYPYYEDVGRFIVLTKQPPSKSLLP